MGKTAEPVTQRGCGISARICPAFLKHFHGIQFSALLNMFIFFQHTESTSFASQKPNSSTVKKNQSHFLESWRQNEVTYYYYYYYPKIQNHPPLALPLMQLRPLSFSEFYSSKAIHFRPTLSKLPAPLSHSPKEATPLLALFM